MARYLILAQSEITANALGTWIELLDDPALGASDVARIVWNRLPSREGAVDAYRTLVHRVETAARADEDRVPLNQVVALVDSIHPANLNAVEEGGSWNNLIAMLILTFPEIRWVFGVCAGTAQLSDKEQDGKSSQQEEWRQIETSHSLASLFNDAVRDPLFDPTRLRSWVRTCTNAGCDPVDDLTLPTRIQIAAAIDEERPYAYLHGYTAYRFGCQADVVMTWALMKQRFQCTEYETQATSTDGKRGHQYWLMLEDMSLNFPDRPRRVHLHCLESQRKKRCAWLDSSDSAKEGSAHRILVTTGQTRPNDPALINNRRYLKGKRNELSDKGNRGRGDVVLKPACGMFDLWEKAGLFRQCEGSRRRGDAPGFFWPPSHPKPSEDEKTCKERSESKETSNKQAHGTPGKLLLVSEALVRRSESLLGNIKCVSEAVQGAVLATDALELTGGRTPTTAIEALSLKHSFEILAECQFSGVEYHISITPRLEEIDLETRAICRWFAIRQREGAMLNARMHIFNQLIGILRQHNQFDEEQICLNRVRHLHATLWMRAKSWRYLFWLPIRYIELLLSSFLTFVLVVMIWIMILGMLFAWVDPGAVQWEMDRWVRGLECAVTSFFSVGPPLQHGTPSATVTGWQVVVSSLAMVSGFLHLGVLVSHLYLIVSRR